MKVELTIDASQLGDTVVDLFNNLSKEKKEELAFQVMKEWLIAPINIERSAKESIVFPKLRDINDNESFYRDNTYQRIKYCDMTDEELRESRRYAEAMKDFRSSKEIMIKDCTESAIAVYRTNSAKLVESDEQLKEIFNSVASEIKNDFPAFIHDAMMYWFTNQLQQSLNASSSAMGRSVNTEQILKNIQQKINIY